MEKKNKELRFCYSDYALIVRLIDNHLVITCPDLNLPIPVVVPCDLEKPSISKMGEALALAFLQVEKYLKDLADLNKSHPYPTEVKQIIPSLPQTLSLSQACRLSGMKADAIRALSDQGKIKSIKTAGGHRRLFRHSLESYLANDN